MTGLKAALVTCCALLLTSCHALQDATDSSTVGVNGVKSTIEQLNTSSTLTAQNLLINDLVQKAGLTQVPTLGSSDWGVVTEAGLYEISRQCDQYLDVLFRFNRNQRAIRQGLTAAGATTATILGLASVAAMPIAITAAAFGLASTLYDAGVNSVLFTIEPSALRNIVLRGRQNYLDKLDLSTITNRPRMMFALQGYLNQCSPATIEANVNDAASGADSVASSNPRTASNAALLAAPTPTFRQRSIATVNNPIQVTPPIERSFKPLNARPAEANVTVEDLRSAQADLGVPVDGDFGPGDNSDTRTALDEFQAGMIRRGWRPEERTRMLAGRTYELLRFGGISPMSGTVFLTPFERAYLGNMTGNMATRLTRIDPEQLETMLDAAAVPRATWQTAPPEQRLQLLRDALKQLRIDKGVALPKGIDPAKARLGVLDFALFVELLR